MNNIIGYIVSIVGLGVLLAYSKISEFISRYMAIKGIYIMILGVALIAFGVVILMTSSSSSSSVSQSHEEVPIYEGIGKNRKIVGYRKNFRESGYFTPFLFNSTLVS